MARLPAGDKGSMKVVRMKSRRTLVTDPATLIPRTSIRVTESEMQVDGDPSVFTDERIETFRCAP
jgi:hypothetical protein